MASMQKTYTGDLSAFIAKKIIAALLKKAKSGKKGVGIEDDDVVGGKSSPVNPITSIVPVRGGAIAKSQDQDPKIEKFTNLINRGATAGEREAARNALKRYTKKLLKKKFTKRN